MGVCGPAADARARHLPEWQSAEWSKWSGRCAEAVGGRVQLPQGAKGSAGWAEADMAIDVHPHVAELELALEVDMCTLTIVVRDVDTALQMLLHDRLALVHLGWHDPAERFGDALHADGLGPRDSPIDHASNPSVTLLVAELIIRHQLLHHTVERHI